MGNTLKSYMQLMNLSLSIPDLDADVQEKSAYIVESGLWEFKVMSFGLVNARATFQRPVDEVLQG